MIKGKKKLVDKKILIAGKTFLSILSLFFIGHVSLAQLYKLGKAAEIITLIISLILVISLLKRQSNYYFYPLFSGFMLWMVLGETTEHLNYGDITNVKTGPLLISLIIFNTYLVRKKILPEHLCLSISFFMIIWTFHFILVNEFEMFGKTSIITYLTMPMYVLLFIYMVYKILRSIDMWSITFYTMFATCCFWSLLEFLWAWNIIGKSW